jgi:hypothetical protein
VIAVREAEVAAALTVGVRVIGVRGVLNGTRHAGNPSCGAAPATLAG